MLIASLLFTIAGTTPSSATTAVVGSSIDFQTLPADATAPGLEIVDDLDVIANLAGATGGTLDVYLQTSPDNATWTDYAHFTQLAAAAPAAVARFTSTRTSNGTLQTVGQALVPLLAAAAIVGGAIPRYARIVAKAGAGTTLGASISIQIRASGNRKPSNGP